jgi:hypothetical protein
LHHSNGQNSDLLRKIVLEDPQRDNAALIARQQCQVKQ